MAFGAVQGLLAYEFLRLTVGLPFLILGGFELVHGLGQLFDPESHGWWGRHRRLKWLATRYPMFLTYQPGTTLGRYAGGAIECLGGAFFLGVGIVAIAGSG